MPLRQRRRIWCLVENLSLGNYPPRPSGVELVLPVFNAEACDDVCLKSKTWRCAAIIRCKDLCCCQNIDCDQVKMADYYGLIKKAIARLDSDAPRESRRALYERARTAQITQLRSIIPPLSGAEITCEQLELEAAVRKIEAEVAERAIDVRVPTLADLVAAANHIGEPVTRSESRSSAVRAKALAKPFSPSQSIEGPRPMTVSGGATGRFVRFWRWRSHSPRSVMPRPAGGR